MAVAENRGDGVTERFDAMYEFEREPVTPDRLESARHFAAVFAGEHVAGTEFVIGALFVSWGAGAAEVLFGLVVGNLLAVLSWTLVCAPIAVQTRLTLYWYLRRIAGPTVTTLYNVLNAILFCVLSGTMITVSASAVRIPFGIPAQTNWYPEDPRFVLLVIIVGAVVVGVAILGFRRMAQFSEICVPWIFCMFIAGALVMLPALAAATPGVERVTSLSDVWQIAEQMVWVRAPESEIGFWHVAAFAWICNLAFHVGLSDMALLRYAPRASYGLLSACGMYLGHFLAWICAGVMGAAAALLIKAPLAQLDAGGVAYQSLGISGALAVIVAGWATSNPTLYRAGLALQAVTPGWPRWLVTLIAGVATTAIACFPFVFTRLLEFVGLFGILLLPVGAIVFVEHWVFPKVGLQQYWASLSGRSTNWPALISWFGAIAVALTLWLTETLHLFFLALPIWTLTAVTYTVLAAVAGARPSFADTNPAGETSQKELPQRVPTAARQTTPPKKTILLHVVGWFALVTLLMAVGSSFWVFASDSDSFAERLTVFHRWLGWLSAAHLTALTFWVLRRETDRDV